MPRVRRRVRAAAGPRVRRSHRALEGRRDRRDVPTGVPGGGAGSRVRRLQRLRRRAHVSDVLLHEALLRAAVRPCGSASATCDGTASTAFAAPEGWSGACTAPDAATSGEIGSFLIPAPTVSACAPTHDPGGAPPGLAAPASTRVRAHRHGRQGQVQRSLEDVCRGPLAAVRGLHDVHPLSPPAHAGVP